MRHLLLVAAIAMLLGGVAHTFVGWPEYAALLLNAGVDAEVSAGLRMGWTWGGACMLACGFICWLAYRKGSSEVAIRGAAAIVGATYLLFGAAATFYRWPRMHFLGFVLMGVIVLLGLTSFPRRVSAATKQPDPS